MKTVILSGGSGTRLYPLTKHTSKQLLHLGGKPMIYYPISLAMLSGSKEIAIITQTKFIPKYKQILGDGSSFGIKIAYIPQDIPDGLASAMKLAEDFVQGDQFVFMLGDNLVYGHDLPKKINDAYKERKNAMFSYYVKDPRSFGVIESNEKGIIERIVEKPENPNSNWASIGLYVFNNEIMEKINILKPSARGEYELPDAVSLLMEDQDVYDIKLGRGYTWFDSGTFTNLYLANNFILSTEEVTGSKIGCLEEIAIRRGFVSSDVYKEYENKGEYYEYVQGVINEIRKP